jgi:hypothetical protein
MSKKQKKQATVSLKVQQDTHLSHQFRLLLRQNGSGWKKNQVFFLQDTMSSRIKKGPTARTQQPASEDGPI